MQEVTRRLPDRVLPATVAVRIGPTQGSGVIIDKQGRVLTAAHVAGAPGREVSFILNDGRTVRGKTLGTNHELDAGLMQITDEGDWPVAAVGVSDTLKVGQWCLSTGHPGGYQTGRKPVLRMGRILHANESIVASDCTLVGGDSGGPLFDMEGRVIGIHSRIGGSLSTNIHVPIGVFRENWDRLAKGESWGKTSPDGPYIGVVGDRSAENARISEVNRGGPADTAGMKAGDVVIRFANRPISDFDSLINAVRSTPPGDRVKIQVDRAGRSIELEVTVGERNERTE